jgi:hypothetical protein
MASYDFTQPGTYPRSGREQVGGICFLPRTIDKTRAHIAGTRGEYVAERGLSSRVYNLFGVTFDQFMEAVRQNDTDDGVLRSLQQHGSNKPAAADVEAHNQAVLTAGPRDDAAMERFRANLARLGFGDRTDVTTHVDAEDLEEGRAVPRRG